MSTTTTVKEENVSNSNSNTVEANIVLTYDVLLNLFTFLDEKSDLAQCSAVCSFWRRVASDPSFHWEQFGLFSSAVYHHYADIEEIEPYKGRFTLEVKPYDHQQWNDGNVIVKASNGTEIGTIRCNEEKYLEFAKQMPRVWRAVPYVVKREEDKKRLNINTTTIFKLKVEFNPKRFEQELKKVRGKEKDFLGFQEAVKFGTSQNMSWVGEFAKRTFNEVRKPSLDDVDEQPEGLLEGVKLYNYQLEALTWMKKIELEQPEVQYMELMPWRVPDSTLYLTNGGDVVWSDRGLSAYIKTAKPKGGVLADEMGLGKTLEMLSLILANPADGPSDELDESPPKREKDDLFYTPATLILCPSHLVKQWVGEIEKYLDEEVSVVTLTTIMELRATTYRAICDADIVIASYQVLKNPNYFRIGHHENLAPRMDEELQRPTWIHSQLKKVRSKTHAGALDSTLPILEHFIWHRLVLDEGHEVLDIPFYFNTLKAFETENKWYMTGTPFAKGSFLMSKVLLFLEFPETESYSSWVQFDPLLEKRFWRNTKASISDEYEIDVYSEEVFILDFTPIERLYYDDLSIVWDSYYSYSSYWNADKMKERKKEFCAMSLGSSYDIQNSLTIAREQFINSITSRLQLHRNRIETANTEIPKLEAQIASGAPIYPHYSPQTQLDDYKTRLKESTENLARDERILADATATKPYDGPDLTKEAGIKDLAEEAEYKSADESDFLNPEDIAEMSIQELKQELEKRDVEYAKSLTKAGLAKLLKQACKNPESVKKRQKRKAEEVSEGEEDEDDDDFDEGSKKRKTKKQKTKRAKGKKDEDADSDEDTGKTKKGAKGKGKGKRKNTNKKEEKNTNKEEKVVKGKKKEKKDEDKKEPTPTMFRNFYVEKLGTKIGNFIFFLKKLWKKDPSARVMVFSQYNNLLEKISYVLFACSINNAFIVGNVLQRNKALTQFKATDSDVKVIMLSLSNSASGTNLIECSHIILMDPLSGTKKEVTAIESQAIGRAYRQGQTKRIKVVRFLIKDTIEHELYKQNHTDVKDVSTLVRTASSLVRADSSLDLLTSHSSITPSLTLTPSLTTSISTSSTSTSTSTSITSTNDDATSESNAK